MITIILLDNKMLVSTDDNSIEGAEHFARNWEKGLVITNAEIKVLDYRTDAKASGGYRCACKLVPASGKAQGKF